MSRPFYFFLILLSFNLVCAQTYNIIDFGAKHGAYFVNTDPINNAINQCSSLGGGTVIIPKGNFITGTIHLKSNVNLNLDRGSVLIGSQDINNYDIMPEGYYYSGKNYMGILFANNVINVSITGKGIIDGRGTFFMKKNTRFIPSKEERKYTRQKEKYQNIFELEDGPLKFSERPGHILTISNAENVIIQDIHFLFELLWIF